MFNIPPYYSRDFLESVRIQPVFSKKIESLINDIIKGDFSANITDRNYPMINKKYSVDLFDSFKLKMLNYIISSKLNNIVGLQDFCNIDICLGCTQFIDNLYLSFGETNIQRVSNEYRYHQRLYPKSSPVSLNTIDKNKHFIISLPFVSGNMHYQMAEILDRCQEYNTRVHIDCAWLSAARNINFNFSHPAIESIGFSLSKGLGLGWNRIGLRVSRSHANDSIKLMNDFQMIPAMQVCIASYFLDNLEVDHLWVEHEERYNKICNDFELTQTNSIHVACQGQVVYGTSDLIRYLEWQPQNFLNIQ
jgi:hypothetical protein